MTQRFKIFVSALGLKSDQTYCWTRRLGLVFLSLSLASCFPGVLSKRDFSTFQSYRFQKTPGLGFCASKEGVFSAEITRETDGTMVFAHSVLVLAGPDPEFCQDGVATNEGCLQPKIQPTRTLSSQEASQVSGVFSDVNFFLRPDQMCREIAWDPCVIERHSWDAKELSDYICGADRLSEDQVTDIRKLLSNLRDGS